MTQPPDPKAVIASLKCDSFAAACERALPIRTDTGETIGRLVPVGAWALGDRTVIRNICDWRQAAMEMFLVRFTSTFERTKHYLTTLSVASQDRIFFLIYDAGDRFVGHIGMKDITHEEGELDNVMRGLPGGHPRLMYFAQVTLLRWCFDVLGLRQSIVRVLSYNPKAQDLYAGIGYVKQAQEHLFRRESDGVTYHDTVEEAQANVAYYSVIMRLSRDDFYKAVSGI